MTTTPSPSVPSVKKVACVGGGVIGAGWAARFLLSGLDVIVVDPDAATPRVVDNAVNAARRAWRKLTLSPPPPEGTLTVTTDLSAIAAADFVQESAPEREELKQNLLAQIDALIAPATIVASSTSGLLPSRLQAKMSHPQRFCVAHPFNPVYLLPLVELCGGDQTAAETPDIAAAFYRSLGMSPLRLRVEIDGFIADRMMEALWREALWLVHDNVATAGEIDDAIRLGCGLRWAFMGPFLTYRLGGGDGGMRHFMEQFAPSLKLPWTKLMDTPELDDALLDKIVAQSDTQAAGRSAAELTKMRDDALVAILQGLRGVAVGAGAALRQYEDTRYATTHPAVFDADSEAPAPLTLHQTQVAAEWIDYNGHMTESRYLQVFGDTTDAFLHTIGVNADYIAGGRSFYTVETHLRHLVQAYLDDMLTTETQVLAADNKRVHLFHTMKCGDTVVATAEHMLLHVENDRAAAADDAVIARVEKILAAHRDLPPPPGAGRNIGI